LVTATVEKRLIFSDRTLCPSPAVSFFFREPSEPIKIKLLRAFIGVFLSHLLKSHVPTSLSFCELPKEGPGGLF
jgi:hypothetical protein